MLLNYAEWTIAVATVYAAHITMLSTLWPAHTTERHHHPGGKRSSFKDVLPPTSFPDTIRLSLRFPTTTSTKWDHYLLYSTVALKTAHSKTN